MHSKIHFTYEKNNLFILLFLFIKMEIKIQLNIEYTYIFFLSTYLEINMSKLETHTRIQTYTRGYILYMHTLKPY